jgi:hypothetical protein
MLIITLAPSPLAMSSASLAEIPGPIPSQLSSLPQLQVLFLTSNHLTGSILSQLSSLTQLSLLSLSLNSHRIGIEEQVIPCQVML